MEATLKIIFAILSLIPLEWLFEAFLLLITAIDRVIRRFVWAAAVVVRRDEHTADTDEWLENKLGFRSASERPPAPPPEPTSLDVLDPPPRDTQFVKDSSWMSPFNVGGNPQSRQGRDD